MQNPKTFVIKMVLTSAVIFLLNACMRPPTPNLTTLDGLEKVGETGSLMVKTRKQLNHIRYEALEETAFSLAAQSALARRSQDIDTVLEAHRIELDNTFNFQQMILDHNVLPPVLLQGDNTLNLASPDTIRLSDRTYMIEQQAHFVTTPPNWRDYLWLSYSYPEIPHSAMMPHNDYEQRIWNENVKKGWESGSNQANAIFQDNLARLSKDYKGLVLYRRLLAQGIVSAPYVAKTELGVTGDGSKIDINDQILRITALPQLQPDSRTWRPAVTVGIDETLVLTLQKAVNGITGYVPGKEKAIHISQNEE